MKLQEMDSIILYRSGGRKTERVADFLANFLQIPGMGTFSLPRTSFERAILVSPTYGDEELPADFEDFLRTLPAGRKKFAVCELGNYYGYDNSEFGASKIIRQHLLGLGWIEFFRPLSLDSLPEIEWNSLYDWATNLKNFLS